MRLVIFIFLSFFFVESNMAQQKQLRSSLRSGNRFYHQENLKNAESEYRKAYEIDSLNTQVLYNLGTDLLMQRDLQQANELLSRASNSALSKNKLKGTKIFHNLGVTYQSAQQYQKAIESYKQALRYNPNDEETRYNLVLCQKLLKNQQQKKNQQQQEQQDKKDQKEEKKEQEKQEQQPQNQMSQENTKQLLEAVKQEERNVKERMNQQKVQPKSRRKSKDW